MHIRQTKLLDIVNRKQKVSVTDLAEALNVSEVTIRKDLTALEQKGLLHRGLSIMNENDGLRFVRQSPSKMVRLSC